MWKEVILVCFAFCTCQSTPTPVFWVTVPAMIQGGTEATVCASLFHPNETLSLTVALIDKGHKRTLLQETVQQNFHNCFQFQAPVVAGASIQNLEVDIEGANFRIAKRKMVKFTNAQALTFIRTDKPIYKQGQTVHFRIFSTDVNFNPINQQYDLVELMSPIRHRIGQWLNITSASSIVQLSFPLNSKAPPGSYMLVVSTGGQEVVQHFSVKDYVLPRFKVKLHIPNTVYIVDQMVDVGVCGQYTYGKPVSGRAVLKVCRESYGYPIPDRSPICHEASTEVNQTGCAFQMFRIPTLPSNDTGNLQFQLHFTATIQEAATGIILNESTSVHLHENAGKLILVDTPLIFHPNSTLKVKIKSVDHKDMPIANVTVFLEERNTNILNSTTDKNGIVLFSVNTNDWDRSQYIHAYIRVGDKYPGIRQIHFNQLGTYFHQWATSEPQSTEAPPPKNSLFIQSEKSFLPCGSEKQLQVKYVITGETSGAASVDLFYLVLSKQAIVRHGRITVPLQEGHVTKGWMSVPLNVTQDLSPAVQLLVYTILPSKTVMATSMKFSTELCFRNKVSMQFSLSQAVPGEAVELKVNALPGSLCGVTVVDQSVLVLDMDKRLTAEDMFMLLPKTNRIPYFLDETSECVTVRTKRSEEDEYSRSLEHAFKHFGNLGLHIITNFPDPPPRCVVFRGVQYLYSDHYYEYDRAESRTVYAGLSEPRTFFPETWVWDLVEVGDSGSALVPLMVPDTITTWETETLCLSPGGLGLAAPTELTVFQPFFLELTLPYSIIRGERFELKATVFNYEPKCIMVTVTVAPSAGYTLEPVGGEQYSSCVCQWKTFRWTLVASVFGAVNVTVTAEATETQTVCDNEVVSVPQKGRVDTVTRSLLVKAEGTEKTLTHSWLLCPNGTKRREEVLLQLPDNVVEGSARGFVSVLGDILGRSLQNLEGMLDMPDGCGEQNMALLASNIYILHYLSATEQLNPDLLQKVTYFLKTGYQRQTRYLHVNGAFSTFGYGTDVNTWLTAFVMRALGAARQFVFVDQSVIDNARKWLQKQQRKDGCYKTVGKLFNNRMKGGVTDDVTMTAYITASMLELNISASDPVLVKSLTCLRKASSNLTNIYATALMAYTFSLAQEEDTQALLMNHLHSVANSDDSLLYWSPPSSDKFSSLSVETTAYVLLAVLTQSSLSTADLGYAGHIAGWLVRQQNPQGGFSSTQDTVVALQALSHYATLTYNPSGSSTVKVGSTSGNQHIFKVEQGNKLVYQEEALQGIPGRYFVEVEGTGCAYVQVALHFNIPPPADASVFKVAARTEHNCSDSLTERHFLFTSDFEYNGPRNSTNMVIVVVTMLSGFVLEESLEELRSHSNASHVETKNDQVILYFNELSQNKLEKITFRLRDELQVENLKPALVRVYDYYQPSDHTVTEYTAACVKD